MDKSEVPSGGVDPRRQPAAYLQLRRGASEHRTWTFGDAQLGTTITVGADASCDWRLGAAGVSPIELYVRFTGDALYARSARPNVGARLDGARLGHEWVLLHHGSRLDVGTACLEAILSAPLRHLAALGALWSPHANEHAEQGASARVAGGGSPRSAVAAESDPRMEAEAMRVEREIKHVQQLAPWRIVALAGTVILAYVGWVILLDYL